MDYFSIAAAIFSAVFWYKAAAVESLSPLPWVGASVIVSAVVMFLLRGGWGPVLLAQVAMFVGITVYRVLLEKKPGSQD